MYIDQKTRVSINTTLKNKYGISYDEFELLDEHAQKIILENINLILDENIKKNMEGISVLDLTDEEKRGVK